MFLPSLKKVAHEGIEGHCGTFSKLKRSIWHAKMYFILCTQTNKN